MIVLSTDIFSSRRFPTRNYCITPIKSVVYDVEHPVALYKWNYKRCLRSNCNCIIYNVNTHPGSQPEFVLLHIRVSHWRVGIMLHQFYTLNSCNGNTNLRPNLLGPLFTYLPRHKRSSSAVLSIPQINRPNLILANNSCSAQKIIIFYRAFNYTSVNKFS
jgi:hypothetical protein